jgi:3-oxoacyl-[acyl-carrier-protein] synthase-1
MAAVTVITGMGAVTPVGLSAEATCAALRAGISRLREIESHLVPGPLFDEVPVVGGRVPLEWYDGPPEEEEWPGHQRFGTAEPPPPWALVDPGPQRLIDLALPAAREAWGPPDMRPKGARVGIYLGLPVEEDPQPLVTAIQEALGLSLARAVAQPGGRAAGLEVLASALQDLGAGTVDFALVGGIDSQLRGPVLERLQAAEQLRTGQNPQGVIPGEGAAFLVLQPEGSAAQGGPAVEGRILAAAVSLEATVASGDPNQGLGLSTVLRSVRDHADLQSPPLVVCDLNGDRYRAMEWGLATIRAFGDLHGDLDFWHPADCIGDAGAALGILNVIWGVTAMRRGYSPSERVIVWGASENGVRGAVVMEDPAS